MESIKFINKKTGEIATIIPILEIRDWEKLDVTEEIKNVGQLLTKDLK